MPLRPIRLLHLEIGERLLDIPWPARTWRDPAATVGPAGAALPAPPGAAVGAAPSGEGYGSALALVRLHDQPLGLVALAAPALGHGEINAGDYAGALWDALGGAINRHLAEDGLPRVGGLTPDGISAGPARCRLERDALLASAPLVSVIVPTRDRPDWLADCLRSLVALEYPRYEIIVVDNAPASEATAELVRREYGHVPNVRYVREPRPGPASARNRGLALAHGEIVAFTDDDAVVDRHWLAEVARGFGRGPDVTCVTGSIVPRELETPAQILFEQFGGLNKGFGRRIFDATTNRPPDRLYPFTAGRFGSGPNMAFRTDALRAMGGFPRALFFGEDLTAFFQTIQDGHQLVYEPAALVFHLHRRDYRALRRQVFAYGSGLVAFFLHALRRNPRLIRQLLWKLPLGLAYLLNPRSRKNEHKRPGYPAELTLLELWGMLFGPWTYLMGSRRCAAADRVFGR